MLKVSILIPTYNQQDFIGKAIESALVQTYKDVEIIISDDASTDNTPDIIRRYLKDKRVKYFRNEQNLGRVQNYRKALYEYATGQWVLNLDGDDYLYDNDFVKNAIDNIIGNKDMVLVAGGCIFNYINENYKAVFLPTEKSHEVKDGHEIFLNWYKNSIPHISALYNRETALKTGFYTEDIISSDWESLLRLVLNGKVLLLNKIAGVWRKHRDNFSTKVDLKELCKNSRFITSPYEYAIKKGLPATELNRWRDRMFRYYINTAVLTIAYSGNYSFLKEFYQYIGENHPYAKKYFFSPFIFFVLCAFKAPKLLDLSRKLKWSLRG